MNEDYELIKGALDKEFTKHLFDDLANIPWVEELTSETGEMVKIKRKMAYVYDTPVRYYYGNLMLMGITWTPMLLEAKDKTAKVANHPFNSVLLNYYKDGKDKINWHSDKEEQLGEKPVIASLNLGAARTFWLLNKASGEKSSYLLEDGDVFIMKENCQSNHLHAILEEKKIKEPRISLTFRMVNYDKPVEHQEE